MNKKILALILYYLTSIFCIPALYAGPFCVSDTLKKNPNSVTMTAVIPQHVTCNCPCTSPRYGGSSVCPVCQHTSIGFVDTTTALLPQKLSRASTAFEYAATVLGQTAQ